MASDAEIIWDLRAEVAALRRVIDGYNTRIAMSKISEEDMKMKIAKCVFLHGRGFRREASRVSRVVFPAQNGGDNQREV